MQNESSLLKAGRILLLIHSIMACVGIVMMFVLAAVLPALSKTLQESCEAGSSSGSCDDVGFPGWMGTLYLVLGILSVPGVVLGFIAYNKAKSGQLGPAFGFGLASALLPPLSVLGLLGAIFCKTCPEASAGNAAPPAPGGWQRV